MRKIIAILVASSVLAMAVDQALAQCAGGCEGFGDVGCYGGCDVGCCGKMKCKKMKCKKVRCKEPRCKEPRCKKKCRHGRKACCADSWCDTGCASGCDAGCDAGCDGAHYGGEYSPGVPTEGPVYQSHETHGLPPAPAPHGGPTTSLQGRSRVRQASFRGADQADLSEGLHLFWSGNYADAEQALSAAADADPGNALPQYFRALSLRQAGQAAAADLALAAAIETEQQAPLDAWGTQMQRVQGADRVWLEDARQAAGI